jgi:ureidoacrylate peracid hydrolase
MHAPYSMSPRIRERAMKVRGQLSCTAKMSPAHTALIVVDMQNYFVAPGAPGEVPAAREIVPVINTLAAQLRSKGATVVWIQTDAQHALKAWPAHHRHVLSAARANSRLSGLDRAGGGFELYPAMQVHPGDLRITKIHYSAFARESSSLDAQLRALGIDTLLIAGAATNVCCESTARDAAMLNYRVAMISDANATWTDEEHTSTLDVFGCFFGDVMSADEAARLLG